MLKLKEDLMVYKYSTEELRRKKTTPRHVHILNKGEVIYFKNKKGSSRINYAGLWIYTSKIDYRDNKNYSDFKEVMYGTDLTLDELLERCNV